MHISYTSPVVDAPTQDVSTLRQYAQILEKHVPSNEDKAAFDYVKSRLAEDIQHARLCRNCHGRGYERGDWVDCHACKGTGYRE